MAFFYRITDHDKRQGTLSKSPKFFWQILCKLQDHSPKAQEIDRKIVQKRLFFLWKKEFALFFHLRQRKTDPKEQSIRVHKEFLTKIVQVKSFDSKDLSRRFKQSFQKKAVFSVTNDFGLLFLVLSSMTNVRKILIRLRKVFWHFQWKW